MSASIRRNKYFVSMLTITIIFAGLTLGNLPTLGPDVGMQTIDGVTYNFANYGLVSHEQLAIFNYLDTLVSEKYQGYGEWDGWNAEDFHGLHHYVIAFMGYAVATLFESTPGYRTSYYRNFAYDLIKKMNTTIDEWGNSSIEYREWEHPDYDFVDYYYPNVTHPDGDDVYTGGFRGPANIMWTAHYALLETLYERNFNTGELVDEISWFVNDWNASLRTDGLGNPKEGGIWGVGLIPCEPYIVFSQCNSVPMVVTGLYDNLYGTNYLPMWDYGRNFINTVMQDEYNLYTDGYFIQEPLGFYYSSTGAPQQFPGPALDPAQGLPKVSSYGISWALAFLDYFQPELTAEKYPLLLDKFQREISGDKMYMMDSYHHPRAFGTYDILGSLFTMLLANQLDDITTRDRLMNFLYSIYNKIWSQDGRTMYFDTSSLEPFLQAALAFAYIWANSEISIRDLVDPRPIEFWDYPFISEAEDENIWVYQAEWDDSKSAFILNLRVDQTTSLTFSNFDHAPHAYVHGSLFADLSPSGTNYQLTLNPGTYNLVIL
ncbi:MAG: hypothetical protein BAJATHORv1_20302 [Candidatus Thorarchaeota archaeon]|nr:MAG: hypothetical protein BAJATHORv1_20302 [Candidatus Thorarchaeota archaeon]